MISKMHIEASDKILDMGAGTGRNVLLMLEYLEKGEVIGLEVGAEMKTQFGENASQYDNLTFRVLRIEQELPFEGAIDKVFISFTLHGFKQKDRINIIENAHRALKTGGKFFILDYNEFDLSKKPAFVGLYLV
ncbi:MAG: methyltransferase domain-containing protein [Candidatus Thorarchaeota archaeon]|nr:methyltransferase domain-containing protein [Candidatus Thorarchaeota archaeon]NIW13172.1 methyltransferase domain-containing protein [Candidatus Thorarchaeota archaeon]NIW51313.1 methyltransferase domain-containing protein [Candidatus Korarchaeota archaeon]